MEQAVTFISAGLTLRGVLHQPDGAAGQRPAMVLCHGFGGSCRGAGHPELAKALEQAGYVALRFDFRGCGQSEGTRGSVIVDEEVADLRAALNFLSGQSGVDTGRIGLLGASLGGSVAIEVTASEPRVKLCVANGAIGKGERRFRAQYRDDAAWQAFLGKLEAAKRDKTTLNRFDVIHIPERDRAGLPPGAIMDFTAETALSLLADNAESVVSKIAPRPLLLVHPRGDGVVPVAESEALAKAAGGNAELHIIDGYAHFSAGSGEMAGIALDFLKRPLLLVHPRGDGVVPVAESRAPYHRGPRAFQRRQRRDGRSRARFPEAAYAGGLSAVLFIIVIPAQAGIQGKRRAVTLGPRFRGDDEKRKPRASAPRNDGVGGHAILPTRAFDGRAP